MELDDVDIGRRIAGIGRSCACLHTRMAARTITRFYAAALRPAGLEATQFSLLAALAGGGAPSVARLADRLAIERTTLLRNLKLLARDGLIERDATPRRSGGKGEARGASGIAYRLTPKGAETLERAVPLWREAQERVEAALGAERLDAFRTTLADLRDVLSEDRAGTGTPPVPDQGR